VKLWRDWRFNVREFLGVTSQLRSLASLRSQAESLFERVRVMNDALAVVLSRVDDLSAERTCTITILADYVHPSQRHVNPSQMYPLPLSRFAGGASATLAEALGRGITFLPRKPLVNLIWFLHAPAGVVIESAQVGTDLVGLGSHLFGEFSQAVVDPSIGIQFNLREIKP